MQPFAARLHREARSRAQPSSAPRSWAVGRAASPGGLGREENLLVVTRCKAVLLSLLASGCSGHTRCSIGTEVSLRFAQSTSPGVEQYESWRNASKSPAETDASVSCAQFSVDDRIVRRFFELAKSTNENDVHDTLDYSPCQAAGEVVFEDGLSGRWTLSQARSGTLAVTGRGPLILYCPDCSFEPFPVSAYAVEQGQTLYDTDVAAGEAINSYATSSPRR